MEFIDLVKKDIKLLQENLIKYLEDTNYPFEDFEYSTYLERSFAYDLITKNIFKKRGDIYRWERIELFKNQFLVPYKNKFKNTNLLWIRVEHYHWFSIESLLRSLYHYLLEEYLNGAKEINLLLEKCMLSFHKFLEQKQLPIEISIYIDGLCIKNSINIDFEFDLISYNHLLSLYSNGYSFKPVEYPYLIYKTRIKAKIELDNEYYESVDPILLEDWERQWDKINLILFSFYLSGLNFSFNKWGLKPPWWIDNEFFNLDLQDEEWNVIKPKAEALFELKSKLESVNEIARIKEIQKLISDSNIMNNPKSQLLINRYFQIFDRKSTQDRILDEFIILESIYTSSSKSEITFRLSLNIASYLGDNKEDFDEIYNFIKDIYIIRSAIIHGDEWKTKLKKKEIKKHFIFEDNSDYISNVARDIFLRLKQFIDKTILKVMKWEIDNEESFFDKATGLFFINHRIH